MTQEDKPIRLGSRGLIKVDSLGNCTDDQPHGHHTIRTSWGEFGCPGYPKNSYYSEHEHKSFLMQVVEAREAAIFKGLQEWLKSIREDHTVEGTDTCHLIDAMLGEVRDSRAKGKFPWERGRQ